MLHYQKAQITDLESCGNYKKGGLVKILKPGSTKLEIGSIQTVTRITSSHLAYLTNCYAPWDLDHKLIEEYLQPITTSKIYLKVIIPREL